MLRPPNVRAQTLLRNEEAEGLPVLTSHHLSGNPVDETHAKHELHTRRYTPFLLVVRHVKNL